MLLALIGGAIVLMVVLYLHESVRSIPGFAKFLILEIGAVPSKLLEGPWGVLGILGGSLEYWGTLGGPMGFRENRTRPGTPSPQGPERLGRPMPGKARPDSKI